MNSGTWNKIIVTFPEPHLLQSWQWGEVKSKFGWETAYKIWGDEQKPDAAALVLQRTIPIAGFAAKLRVLYVPKGPLLRDWDDDELRARVLDDLQKLARERGAIFIKIDPDVPLGKGIPGESVADENPLGDALCVELTLRGWRFSGEQIQYRNTVLLDLTAHEDEMLARMKQKTRYNIRYAGRKGVVVRIGTANDLNLLYRMYAETSARDGFVIRGEEYYQSVWGTFLENDMLDPLVAEVDEEPVGGLMLFRFADRAWYLHGMSRDVHRKKMPNYLLQWEAMRRAKEKGCTVYDLWGAPNVFDESDPMWGVFRFKRGLGGTVQRTIGAYDYPVRPMFYKFYVQLLPHILDVIRKQRKSQIVRIHEGHEER
ncbi:MAG: peptidoglycan bridge formation glycyltransferase FemA/FemB family protein [Anaerolineales bacterium]|nr:peptidoglycan bridge formation glycyltransferase FemA/FemB family protein [Chloroflexota bacterium]MBL6983741.1 peptidoglycan bridge formation glycyltransferase FemA/FemB family protein [Anaerolineales bacterium]